MLQNRVSTGRDVPRDVTGQTGTGRPVVPLSRDKKKFLSRCPFVPGQGQEQMSRDKLLCPVPSRDKITFPKEQKNRKRTFQNRKKAFQNRKKDVLKQVKDVLKQKRMFQNRKRCSKTGNHRKKFHFINVFSLNSVPRDVPGRDGTSCQNPVPSRPVAKF